VSVITVSAIKADTGGYVGHCAVHPEMLAEAQRRVGDAVGSGLLIDGSVNSCGDDVNW
jgi:fructose 1,6-bisphosphate aldolase/phosphatase